MKNKRTVIKSQEAMKRFLTSGDNPTETINLSEEHPEKVVKVEKLFDDWKRKIEIN